MWAPCGAGTSEDQTVHMRKAWQHEHVRVEARESADIFLIVSEFVSLRLGNVGDLHAHLWRRQHKALQCRDMTAVGATSTRSFSVSSVWRPLHGPEAVSCVGLSACA